MTEGEILYGVARRPEAKKLRATVEELLSAIDILPWTSAAAQRYGTIRAELERRAKPLGALDLMIAATRCSTTPGSRQAIAHFAWFLALRVEDWTAD